MKSETVGRFRKLAGNEFQTVGAMKIKKTVVKRFEIAFRDFQVSKQREDTPSPALSPAQLKITN